MGHLPFNKLHLLHTYFSSSVAYDTICQICHKAKQPRLAFAISTSRATKCFALLHIDTWDPFRLKTHDGYNYFLTIVDNCSRNTWTFLMKNKTDVVSILITFFAMVNTQHNSKILSVRTDNVKELCEGEMLTFFNTQGIVPQKSCADTPQQYGVVERKHRHLLETARALYFHSKAPTRVSAYCVPLT